MSTSKRSYAAAFRATVAAFLAAETHILGRDRTWIAQAGNSTQLRLLDEVFPGCRQEARLVTETDCQVSWSADVINAFLKERGIDIRLEELGPDTFAFAALMKVMCPWAIPGAAKQLLGADGLTYPGACLPSEYTENCGRSVVFTTSAHFKDPIATVLTTSADVVHITKFDEDLDPFDLIKRVQELNVDARPIRDFDGVHFPAVDLDVCPDISWLMGLSTTDDDGRVATLVQALQQCKLQMNHKGAIVTDAFAGAASFECCSIPKPDLVIDDSFLFVLERPSLSQPVVSLVIRPEHFKDPGELSFS